MAASSSVETPPADPDVRDKRYYFENITFKVEDSLFCVPKHGFTVPGTPFETMFTLPSGNVSLNEGRDDMHPVVLPISAAFFRGFLRVLYPFYEGTPTYDEWIGALDLATMWDFTLIRTKSITAVTELIGSREPVDKILLGKKYKVPQWLRDGYTQIVQQKESVNVEDLCSRLDALTVARLLSVREKTLLQPVASPRPSCSRCSHNMSRGYDTPPTSSLFPSQNQRLFGGFGNTPQHAVDVDSPPSPTIDINPRSLAHMDQVFQVEFSEM